MKVCDKCGRQNADDAVFCFSCGHMIGLPVSRQGYGSRPAPGAGPAPRPAPGYGPGPAPGPAPRPAPGYGPRPAPGPAPNPGQGAPSTIVNELNDFIGNENSVPLKWTDLFVSVFKKHTPEEAEYLFIYGTRKTTPPLYAVSSDWPKPWLYSRVLLIMVITYALLWGCWTFFENANAIPGIITIGSLALPLATLIMFYEVNVYRNISIYYVFLFFLIGGGASLLATLFLYALVPLGSEIGYLEASLVSIIEETGKCLIVYFFLKKLPDRHYILNGLLVGAAVGAGFAVFESSGYALRYGMSDIDSMFEVIRMRAFLSPGGHIAWAAVAGAALVYASGNAPLTARVFSSGRFWKLMLFPLVMHALWDSPFLDGIVMIKCLGLCVAIWVILLILVSMGLSEVKKTSFSR